VARSYKHGTVMRFEFHKIWGMFLANSGNICLSRETMFHGVCHEIYRLYLCHVDYKFLV